MRLMRFTYESFQTATVGLSEQAGALWENLRRLGFGHTSVLTSQMSEIRMMHTELIVQEIIAVEELRVRAHHIYNMRV